MKNSNTLIGKTIYALIFLVVAPAILWYWASFTNELIDLPVLGSPDTGRILIVIGGILILWGMYALRKFGNGLPMNAFPPEKFVTKGPYRLFRHPIYWGFGMLMTGVFMLTNSPAGLWVVTPVTILSMIALVWGYEKIDLEKRFPKMYIKTIFDLTENSEEATTLRDRLFSFALIVGLLIFCNYLIVNLLPANTGISLSVHPIFENPVLPYLSLGYILLIIFIVKKNNILRDWTISGVLGLSYMTFFAMIYPSLFAGHLVKDSSEMSGIEIYLSAVPLFLILISANAYYKNGKTGGIIFGIIGLMVGLGQLSSGTLFVEHLMTSLLLFFVATQRLRVWLFLINASEIIANSWREWTFGKVRIINHGFYVGVGSFAGILLAGILAGRSYAWAILLFAFIVIVFSALWAQIIEGSEKLKRPYGFYGALVGIIFASLAMCSLGFNVWIIIGVISVVMPWVQAIGRLRCLINGCCHGGVIENSLLGIRYFHYRSRVCGVSNLRGELLHPTPVYSMIWLFFAGFIILALWQNGLPNSFIFGMYLILNGIGRFIEEAYRGEVQTPILNRLRLYQWTAIISVLIGIVMTCIPSNLPIQTPDFGWEIVLAAAIGGLFTMFAMGVDFPYSNARFSRLV